MKDYTTLIFDAFDTIVHINWSKLPVGNVDGKSVHTSATAVYAIYTHHFGHIEFTPFYGAFIDSFSEAEKIRRTQLRELPSPERFRIMLRILGHTPNGVDDLVLEQMVLGHMRQLQQAMEIRPETAEVLTWAAPRFRRAMISNFDYAPALYQLLERFGIRDMFEAITISSEAGWCKPHPAIFERTFQALGIQPSEALFVGDQLHLDVAGALQVGMDVAWIETGRETWTPDYPKPTFTVRCLRDIMNVLTSEGEFYELHKPAPDLVP